MTQAEFEKLPREQRPPKRNLTLEQFIEEQNSKTDSFDYESVKTRFADSYDEKTHTMYSRAWEISHIIWHLNTT